MLCDIPAAWRTGNALKYYVLDLKEGVLHYFILSLFIIPIIYTTILLNKKNASYFSCVVYLSIVVNHLSDDNPFFFVMDRSFDTLIGIAVGLVINLISQGICDIGTACG